MTVLGFSRAAVLIALFAGISCFGLASAGAAAVSVNVPCSGPGGGADGLVAAINAANNGGGGAINLAKSCTYQLAGVDNTDPSTGPNGLPVVTSSVSVNGRDATIAGNGADFRIFEVSSGGSLTLNMVTVTGGAAPIGGGIANVDGAVTLNHSLVTGNTASQAGGGIASATFDPSNVATLTLNQSSVSENSQTDPGSTDGLGGGGILNILGTVTLNNSEANGNTAQGFVGGGIASGDYLNFSDTSSVVTINNSEVNGNIAPNAGGGGIQNLLGTLTVRNSRVNGNSSLNGGGISSGPGNGGLPGATSHLTVSNSQVNGNTATAPVPTPGGPPAPPIAAGGIANGGDAVLNNSKVDNNTASFTSGGGIVNHGSMTLNNSEVNGNTAAGSGVVASGGGIVSAQGPPGTAPTTLTLNNSSVNDNTAGGVGGGIANGIPLPGPPPLFGGTLTLNNSRVADNTAGHGGGIFNFHGTVTLSNSKVTKNNPDNCEPPGTIGGCTG
jgi:hypothetical protein